MRYFIGHTNANTRKAWEESSKGLAGIDPNVKKARWKTCVREMDDSLGFLAGEFYVRKKFNGVVKEQGRLMIEQIKDAYNDRFAELDWIDDETHMGAVKKVKNLRVKIGYNEASPNMSDPVELAKYARVHEFHANGTRYYEEVEIQNDTFFDNYLSYKIADRRRTFSSAGELAEKEKWHMTPMVLFHDCHSNSALECLLQRTRKRGSLMSIHPSNFFRSFSQLGSCSLRRSLSMVKIREHTESVGNSNDEVVLCIWWVPATESLGNLKDEV